MAAAVAVAAAGILMVAGGATAPAAAQSVPRGAWATVASGNDILALLVDGSSLWAGTRAGGLIRWNVDDGTYAQYLHPQAPLGGNTVFDLALDQHGRLWMATSAGLTVFDNAGTDAPGDDRWFTYTTQNGLGLPSDEVHAVAASGDLVWVGGVQTNSPETGDWSGGGLGCVDTKGTFDPSDDQWAPISTFDGTYKEEPDGTSEPGLVSDTINDLLVTPQGNVWVATSPHWRVEQAADPEAPPDWQRQHGGLSFVATHGTLDTSDDDWTGFSCELLELTVTCNVRRLAMDSRGRGWAADGGRGLIHFDVELGQLGGPQARIAPPSGQGDSFVMDMAFGPTDVPALANTVWLATRSGGVAVLDHKGTLANLSDDVWNLDRGGPFGLADGLVSERVQAIALAGGRMFLGLGSSRGVGGGLQAIDLDTQEVRQSWLTARAPSSNFITDLAFGAAGSRWEGQVWVATGTRGGATGTRLFGNGAGTLDTGGTAGTIDDSWTGYTALSTDNDGKLPWTGLGSDNVQAIALDGDTVWLGTAETRWDAGAGRYADGGLSVFDGQQWTARRAVTGEATAAGHGGVSSLLLGCDGELWVGTGNQWDNQGSGVFVRAAGSPVHEVAADTWTQYKYPQLASANTSSLVADCAGRRVWVGALHHVNNAGTGGQPGQWAGGGLAGLDLGTGQWTRLTVDQGLETFASAGIKGEVVSVALTGGSVLAGTFGTKEMTAPALVSTRPYWPAVFNEWSSSVWTAHVLPHSGMVSSMAVDGAGRIWVATSRGGMARDSVTPDGWITDDAAGGLFVRQGNEWTALTSDKDGIPANDLSVVRVAPDQSVWVGSAGWGLARFDPNAEPPTPTPDLGLPTRTASPTHDPNAATPTRVTTPATVRPPVPSPTHPATPTRPGRPQGFLPVTFSGHAALPVLAVRILLPFASPGR